MNIEKLHEECAVFGISIDGGEAAGLTYNGLLAMQHRGQEGAGIAVLSDRNILYHKGEGLVSEVFTAPVLAKQPQSHIAVGHCRYSTTGNNSPQNVQPFLTEYLTGRIATVHNGNITNAGSLRAKLTELGCGFTASSDSEVVSSLVAYEIVSCGDTVQGVINAARQMEGAFSMIVLTSADQLIAVRDPHGFRPLCIGESPHGTVIASESCALDSCDFKFLRDVMPGEVVVVEDGKIVSSSIELHAKAKGICIFEYVYFARPDSVIEGLSVYEARCNMGRILAKEHPVEADMVCGVPDSGNEAAVGYAQESGIPLIPGFVKNRYIGRSFIFPTQLQRESAVRMKLNPLRHNVDGKRVILVDDSIVRGTTSARIVKTLRDAGAKEVHLRISSPPFRHTCYFGTDIGDESNLIANKISIEEIREKINVDSLGFISEAGLRASCNKCSLPFCMGCFTGDYGVKVEAAGKHQFETKE